jgi:hypothetical protein
MSDSPSEGFGKFVPGFDFLQNLTKGASQSIPQMPNMASWIAPTLDVEELDKRISELKAVHFWLDQNSKALGATVQALEVQKMTLAALKGMNVNMGDLANSFKPKAAEPVDLAAKHEREKAAAAAHSAAEAATAAEVAAKKERRSGKPAAKASAGLVDPMQLWGALTQQFQQIAATAMKDVTKHTAADAVSNPAAGTAKPAEKATKKVANNAAATRAAARKVIKKPATRSR